MKRDIVCEDEFDKGLRQLLNLGHTFGHAIESCSNYTIGHGHCVATGMALISRAAAENGLCSTDAAQEVIDILTRYGLPTESPYGLEQLSRAVLSDKKIVGSAISLVVPREVGRCELRKIPASELHSWLRAGGVV